MTDCILNGLDLDEVLEGAWDYVDQPSDPASLVVELPGLTLVERVAVRREHDGYPMEEYGPVDRPRLRLARDMQRRIDDIINAHENKAKAA